MQFHLGLVNAAELTKVEEGELQTKIINVLDQQQKKGLLPDSVRESRTITKRLEMTCKMIRQKWKDLCGQEVTTVCKTMADVQQEVEKKETKAEKKARRKKEREETQAKLQEAKEKEAAANVAAAGGEIKDEDVGMKDNDIDIEEVEREIEEFLFLRHEGELGEKPTKEAMKGEWNNYFRN